MGYTRQQITRLEALLQRVQVLLARPDLTPDQRATAERILPGVQAMLERRKANRQEPDA